MDVGGRAQQRLPRRRDLHTLTGRATASDRHIRLRVWAALRRPAAVRRDLVARPALRSTRRWDAPQSHDAAEPAATPGVVAKWPPGLQLRTQRRGPHQDLLDGAPSRQELPSE